MPPPRSFVRRPSTLCRRGGLAVATPRLLGGVAIVDVYVLSQIVNGLIFGLIYVGMTLTADLLAMALNPRLRTRRL